MTSYLIIDFNALFHRSRNALKRGGRSFSSPEGFPTTGVFSSLAALFSLTKEHPDHKVVIATEGKNSTASRKTASEGEYKEHRGSSDPDFITELTFTLDALRLLYPVLSLEGLEGDDTIASLVRTLPPEGSAVVYSCDRDLIPLVSNNVDVLLFTTNKKRKLWDLEAVKAEYGGFHGRDLYTLKSLTGDKSDNITGHKGVGLKTAIKLVETGALTPEHGATMSRNLPLILPHLADISLADLEFPESDRNSQQFNTLLESIGIYKVKHR